MMDEDYYRKRREALERRRKCDRDFGVFVACVVITMILFCGLVAYFSTRKVVQEAEHPTRTAVVSIQTENGSDLEVYSFVDPKTEIEYLITSKGYICVRGEKEGSANEQSGAETTDAY